MDGIYRLRDAIVERAAKDYLNARVKVLKKPNKPKQEAVQICEDVKRWFYSPSYTGMDLNLSPSFILNKLDKAAKAQVDEERKKKDVYKRP